MNIATIKVSGVKAVTNDYPTIPAGIVGATVTFEFTDPAWDGLNKTAVFRGCVTRDVLMTGNVVRIPAETVAQACPFLFVGIYGTDAADNLVIPTLWLSLGAVRDSADPSGDPGTDPDLPVWAQLQDRVEALESGTPSDPDSPGTPGRPGEDGEDGGYYTPAVTQPSSDIVEFAFSPSKADMPAVDPVQVKLPVGQGSGGNVDQAQIEQAVADYLEKNPVTGGAPGADGKDGVSVTHFWNGTTLTVTSASGTSSSDLKGDPGADGSDANVTAENIQTALGYTPADAEDVTQLQSDVERILTKDEKNLFSFDDADENLSILSKNSSSTNYINQTSSDYGYKDTDNGYFVCNGGGYNYAITGGMALRPPSGSYKLSAEIYIPSGNTNRTMVAFGVCAFPPNSSGEFKQKTNFDLGTQDTWVNVECVIAVTDDHTAVYISMHSYIDTYPFYMRNIKLISLEPEQTGWEGKKWVAIGDSITEKNSTSLKNYHDYIAESTGINVVNMGVSGTGYKTKFDTSGAFYQRISNVPTDADVVTIFGGGNDLADIWDTYGLGKATDTGTDTICGCINTAIDNLYAVLPTVQLGIITPTPWGAYNTHNNSASGNRMTLLVEKIIEICEYRGIPCLDLYHCSGLRPWDSAFCELAFSAQASIHPNEVGHSIIAPRIYNFLESLVPLG